MCLPFISFYAFQPKIIDIRFTVSFLIGKSNYILIVIVVPNGYACAPVSAYYLVYLVFSEREKECTLYKSEKKKSYFA